MKDKKKQVSLKKIIKKLVPVIFIVPLIIGVVSYYCAGESILDALYYSIDLYMFNFKSENMCIAGLEVARWTAPLMTATWILVLFKNSFYYVRAHLMCLKKNSNVVYGNSEYAKALCENMSNSVLWQGAPVRLGKNHIIMFDTDIDNFSFCRENLSRLKGKNVYLCLKDTDAAIFKETLSEENDSNMVIRFFNYNDVIARNFWKERSLWKNGNQRQKVAIIGFDSLGKRILEVALQLNLYSKNQSIEYYVFGNAKGYSLAHSFMRLMNQDKVFYYDKDCKEQWELLDDMDMIVLTETADMDLFQSVLGCSKCPVYYYSPKDDDISSFVSNGRLYSFGENRKVFTEENVKTDKLYRNAKELNHKYEKSNDDSEQQKEKEWNALSGFDKGSNISAADYGEVLQSLIAEREYSEELEIELAELEHIRWCRYHFIHYWRYGIPKNKSNKDTDMKIHRCLIPFAELEEVDRDKDIDVIRAWVENINN